MIIKEKDGLAQRMIATICGFSTASVSRAAAARNLLPINPDKALKQRRYPLEESIDLISSFRKIENKRILKQSFAFYNFKGGTGKTSMCFQVSAHFAFMGFKVLVIDADPQGHLSTSYGFNNDDSYFTLYDFLVSDVGFTEVRKNIFRGLDIIPANLSLTRMEVALNQMPKREERLLSKLKNIKSEYDFIFIDTNPTISLLNRNVITFCDALSIVCETQPYSLNGLKLLMEDLKTFFRNMDIKDKCIDIIPNKYEDRTSTSAEAMTVLHEYYGQYIKHNFAIRKSEDINIAAKIGKPLALFAKVNSIALRDILDLVEYYMSKYVEDVETK